MNEIVDYKLSPEEQIIIDAKDFNQFLNRIPWHPPYENWLV